MGMSMASSCGEAPRAGHGMALGLLDGRKPWVCPWQAHVEKHQGQAMEWHWGSWMGGSHGYVHGKLMWRSTKGRPWNGIGALGWVEAMGMCPWQAHVEKHQGQAMEWHWCFST